MQLRKVMLRHLRILVVVKKGKKGFSSSQFSSVTFLEDVVYMECDEEPALFLVSAVNSFICHKNAIFEAHPSISLHFYYKIR